VLAFISRIARKQARLTPKRTRYLGSWLFYSTHGDFFWSKWWFYGNSRGQNISNWLAPSKAVSSWQWKKCGQKSSENHTSLSLTWVPRSTEAETCNQSSELQKLWRRGIKDGEIGVGNVESICIAYVFLTSNCIISI